MIINKDKVLKEYKHCRYLWYIKGYGKAIIPMSDLLTAVLTGFLAIPLIRIRVFALAGLFAEICKGFTVAG